MIYPGHRKPRTALGALAIMVGCLVLYLGNKLIGIRIELYYGLDTFNILWFLELFILPFFAGVVVSYIFGFGGKWLAHFPPLIILGVQYFESIYLIGVPEHASLIPMGWWGFFVILAIECSAAGGVAGEVWFKAYYKESGPDVKRVQSK
ncbi:MAG: hypothetical protein GXP19_03965 [Gammaproteobacteria bacterium]|nr:hypothetical protein [Gammaproteobacteria bacterium]